MEEIRYLSFKIMGKLMNPIPLLTNYFDKMSNMIDF